MSEWWTYRLDDFLLFSPRTYWRLFAAQNTALWPLQLATTAAGLAVVLAILRPSRRAALWPGLVFGLVMAAVWAFTAWSFLLQRYAPINWAVAYAVPAFFLEAGLLLLAGLVSGGTVFRRADAVGGAGLALAVAGLLLYPALPLVSGRPLASAEVFGLAPDPTAIVTAGLLLVARGRWLAVLLPIPLLWCLLSGLTLLTMGDGQAWLPLASAALVAALAVTRLVPRTAGR
ncbi:DUF6064 family protein [Methylobrevis albus]|uniref:MFS transporter permease n=1 Tax=Methylobrevis albus TaxID=2793297 RepID=A0A931I4G3_9HYPH|nr:DUF6064 family protein [Methylobrevis albus]MBH0239071.1 hypothetical protein [Methylobrevis albus]